MNIHHICRRLLLLLVWPSSHTPYPWIDNSRQRRFLFLHPGWRKPSPSAKDIVLLLNRKPVPKLVHIKTKVTFFLPNRPSFALQVRRACTFCRKKKDFATQKNGFSWRRVELYDVTRHATLIIRSFKWNQLHVDGVHAIVLIWWWIQRAGQIYFRPQQYRLNLYCRSVMVDWEVPRCWGNRATAHWE